MSPRLITALLFAATFSTASFAQTEEEDAGDTTEIAPDQTEPLRDRIQPVSGHVFLKRGRFELTPSLNLSVKDAFFTKYVANLALTFHPLEELGISLRGGYAFNTVAGSMVICPPGEGCAPPSFERLDGRAPGQMRLLAGADVQYAPIYGKIAVMAESFLHFDMYALAGATMVQYLSPDDDGTGSIPEFAVGGSIGGGMRVFLNSWMTVRAEVRDVIYVENIAPRPASSLRHQIMVELGISIFLPTSFKAPR